MGPRRRHIRRWARIRKEATQRRTGSKRANQRRGDTIVVRSSEDTENQRLTRRALKGQRTPIRWVMNLHPDTRHEVGELRIEQGRYARLNSELLLSQRTPKAAA